MRLNDSDGMIAEKLLQVFIEMAVVVISKMTVMKTFGMRSKPFNGFADPQNLQSLFTGNAGGSFKITLQCSGTDVVTVR